MSWKILPENTLVQKHLAKELSLHPITAQLLVNRGIFDIESAQRFLSPRLADLPDPFSLIDMAPAVTRILHALQEHEQIAIYGDYDVDGTTSCALLYHFFKMLDIEIEVIHTPGHSPGSSCFIFNGKIITGDTLFVGSVGRTDLPGGDSKVMAESLKRLKKLDDNLEVYPGHDYGDKPFSTIGEEKENNFFMK